MIDYSFDILIIGGGAAGLRASIAAAKNDKNLRIGIISKVYPMRSHTVAAEGGAAAALRDDDNFDLHALDTIKGSDYLADQDVVEMFVQEAPKEVIQLDHWGCPWSRDEDGKLSVRAFGGMSVKRTHLASDKTGFHLLHTLFQTSLQYPNISRCDEWLVTSLVVENNKIKGVVALELHSGQLRFVATKSLILATGGAGRIFAVTSNGAINTGSGMALAYRAGDPLKDMEFIQFHPTGLPKIGTLITEGARGEGGYLVNKDNERFLSRYIPNKMELGPRDIISRAIITELEQGKGFGDAKTGYVHLDLRHLGKDLMEERLPFVLELSRTYLAIDPLKEPIPVRPTVHYTMGGIHTNIDTETPIEGLYACGEAACISLNGANRLGSNSLTECLVFGARSGEVSAIYAKSQKDEEQSGNKIAQAQINSTEDFFKSLEDGTESVPMIQRSLRQVMDENCGVFRKEDSLQEALSTINELKERYSKVKIVDSSRTFNVEILDTLELGAMLEIAETIVESAIQRKESRGAHVRRDFPDRDDEKFLSHSLAHFSDKGPKIEYLPVTLTKWKPEERKY